MKIEKAVFLVVLVALLSTVGSVQATVRGLEDLEGVRSDMGDYHLKRRGYVFSHSEKASHATFHYYSNGGDCVVVEAANDRFESIQSVRRENCNETPQFDRASLYSLRSLVGLPARNGDSQLQHRGYRFERAEKFQNSDFHFYSKGHDCIAVEVSDGRYQAIRETIEANCGSQVSDIFNSEPASGVDYPRVQADTDGEGSFYVPGIGSSQVDRGYVWLHEDRPMIGFSFEGENHAKFYGVVTRMVGAREYEIDIQDSNVGVATGTGIFRLSPDQKEVEIVKVDGTIGGRRFTGNFERAWMVDKRKTGR